MRTTLLCYCLMAVALFMSCNAARQLAKQDEQIAGLKKKWIAEWVKENPCPQLPEINLDSLCAAIYGESTVDDYVPATTGDTPAPATPRETPGQASPQANDSKPDCKPCKPCKPKRILVPGPPDNRRIHLLEDSLKATKLQLYHCQGQLDAPVQHSKWEWNNWSWLFVASVALGVIRIIIKYKYKIAWL